MSREERALIAATERYEEARARFEKLTDERVAAIQRARDAGISQRRVMEITGLSRQRVNQIFRGEEFLQAHRERMSRRRKNARAA